MHGYSTTVMALEGSADEATRLVGGTEVNHQWSKSTECESELRDVLAGIAPGIGYGSALRSLSELEIGRCFSALAPYHHIFRSCNRAFSLSNPVDGWCNNCPKCRFVYLTLATSMNREEIVAIFGSDLLGSAEQVDGFRDLFDMERKPFECVGTRSESIAAFKELLVSPVWSSSVVVGRSDPSCRQKNRQMTRQNQRARTARAFPASAPVPGSSRSYDRLRARSALARSSFAQECQRTLLPMLLPMFLAMSLPMSLPMSPTTL